MAAVGICIFIGANGMYVFRRKQAGRKIRPDNRYVVSPARPVSRLDAARMLDLSDKPSSR